MVFQTKVGEKKLALFMREMSTKANFTVMQNTYKPKRKKTPRSETP